MTQQEIIEGNKLIFLFMGGREMSSETSPDGVKTIKSAQLNDLYARNFLTDLKYHSSWDWLLPVIKTAKTKINKYDFDARQEASARLKAVTNEVCNINIENAHFCLVKFITWYNTQSPNL